MPAYGIELLGGIAAILTTMAFFPQALRTVRTRSTADISLMMSVLLVTGVGFWLVYGLLLMSWPLILANAATFVLNLVILGVKLRNGGR